MRKRGRSCGRTTQPTLTSMFRAVGPSGYNNTDRIDGDDDMERDNIMEELFGIDGSPNDLGENDFIPQTPEENVVDREAKRSWKEGWRLKHEWAYPVKDANGSTRIKCKWCSLYRYDNVFSKEGSTTIQLSALDCHAKSEAHKSARSRWEARTKGDQSSIVKKVENMIDLQKERVKMIMQIAFFHAMHNYPLACIRNASYFNRYLGTPNIPSIPDYSAYANAKAAKEFLFATQEVMWEKLKSKIQRSPFYSILIDESTDRGLEHHMIVYITFVKEGGNGDPTTRFIRLLKMIDGTAMSKYNAIILLLAEMGLLPRKMVAMGSDGASSMTGESNGLIALLRRHVPHILLVHCVAHCEALAMSKACKEVGKFVYMDKIANKVATWLNGCAMRIGTLYKLEEVFGLKKLNVTRIHEVRWLSRGKVMERLVQVMSVLLENFSEHDKRLFSKLSIYQVQFGFHLLADILIELNILSQSLQYESVDLTTIGALVDTTIEMLKIRFMGSVFGRGAKYTSRFLDTTRDGSFKFVDTDRIEHIYTLRYECLPGSTFLGTLEGSIDLGKRLVQNIIDKLGDRFVHQLSIFNACKIFSPRDYDNDRDVLTNQIDGWCLRLLDQFSIGEAPIVDKEKCEGEIDRFTILLKRCFSRKNMIDAWRQCAGRTEWVDSFPVMV